MKPLFLPVLLGASVFFLMPLPGRAGNSSLPSELDLLDQQGYFSAAFKAAVHELIDSRKALEEAGIDVKTISAQLPALQQQSEAAQAKTDALRKELATYQHPENGDFAALLESMQNPSAKPEDQLALAQAFLWAYPSNRHADEARQDLQVIQKKLADQQQAEKDAQAADAAKQAQLLQRVQARQLSLNEWKVFLQDKSQEEVLKYLGRPDIVQADYWTYNSAFTVDPATGQKVGLQVNFNGTRVNTISAGPNISPAPAPSAP